MENYTEEMCYNGIINKDEKLEEYFKKQYSEYWKLQNNYNIAKERNHSDLGKYFIQPIKPKIIINYENALNKYYNEEKEKKELDENIRKLIMKINAPTSIRNPETSQRLKDIYKTELKEYLNKKYSREELNELEKIYPTEYSRYREILLRIINK